MCYGDQDVDLSDEGIAASVRLADGMSGGDQPVALYHSDLSRTRMLAERLATRFANATIQGDRRLRERHYGAWQGQPWDDVFDAHADTFHDLIEKPDTYAPPGGETTSRMQQRMVDWYHDVGQRHRHQTVIAVSHSGPIAALAGWCLDLHPTDWQPWTIKNLHGVRIHKDASDSVNVVRIASHDLHHFFE